MLFIKDSGRWNLVIILFALAWTPSLSADEPSASTGTRTNAPILALEASGHTDAMFRLRFTRDGRYLVTSSKDKTVRIWSVATGEPLRVLRPPIGAGRAGSLYGLALSPDGQTVACGGIGLRPGENPIYLIDFVTGAMKGTLAGHGKSISDIAWSPDGAYLASVGEDRIVRIWDMTTNQWKRSLEGHTDWVLKCGFAPDSRRVASASCDGTVRLWNVETGGLDAVTPHAHEGDSRWATSVAWSPDGQTIASGGADRCIRLWSTNGTLRKEYPQGEDAVQSLTFTADSQRLLVTRGRFSKFECTIFDIVRDQEVSRFKGHTDVPLYGGLSPDGSLAATSGFFGNELFLWKTADGSLVRHLGGQSRAILTVAWSPDGSTIAWGSTGKRGNPAIPRPLERTFRPAQLEFGPEPDDSYQLAVKERRGLTLVPYGDEVAVQQNDTQVSILRHRGYIRYTFSFFSDQRAVIGASFGLYLYDVPTGNQLRSFQGHSGDVLAVAPSPDDRYLLSGGCDQSLRIWTADRDEPLLTLFVAGDDWIAWTPEGYYATSPGGERLMGWHVNNGEDQMASFFPALQFRKSLYRPDVIKLLLKAGSTQRALEMAGGQQGPTRPAIRVEEVLPPKIKITIPEKARVETSQTEVEVRATAKALGRDPITNMRLLLDGRPYDGAAGVKGVNVEETAVAEVARSWTVRMTPGTHFVIVRADTAKSYALSEPIELVCRPQQQQTLPAMYVLSVGISQYRQERLRLKWGAADARALADTLKKTSAPLFRKVETRVLTDDLATRQEILKGLKWLKSQMTQHDVGLFAFSGHGDKDSDDVFYLIPTECQPDDLATSGVAEDQIKRYFQSTPGRVLVLLDCCHAGALGGDRRKSASGLTDNLVRDLVSDDYGVIIMCSSMGREISQESDRWGHGVFTKALIEGLEGAADYDHDGAVCFTELDHYVSERVKGLTDGRQHPSTQKPITIRNFPLARP